MVAVEIPVVVRIVFGRSSVDYEVSGRKFVETADDIQESCFSAARVPENGHKLALAEFQVYALQGMDGRVSGQIIFFYSLQFKHGNTSPLSSDIITLFAIKMLTFGKFWIKL